MKRLIKKSENDFANIKDKFKYNDLYIDKVENSDKKRVIIEYVLSHNEFNEIYNNVSNDELLNFLRSKNNPNEITNIIGVNINDIISQIQNKIGERNIDINSIKVFVDDFNEFSIRFAYEFTEDEIYNKKVENDNDDFYANLKGKFKPYTEFGNDENGISISTSSTSSSKLLCEYILSNDELSKIYENIDYNKLKLYFSSENIDDIINKTGINFNVIEEQMNNIANANNCLFDKNKLKVSIRIDEGIIIVFSEKLKSK